MINRPLGGGAGGSNSSEPPSTSVSSYASLASGPPPCYVRNGGNPDSYDYVDKPLPTPRSPSPLTYGRHSQLASRGGGGRFEHSNERTGLSSNGGRGRSYRGGRDRPGRGYSRYPDGQHLSLHSERSSAGDFESGESQAINRSSLIQRRSEDRGSFEGRGGRASVSSEPRGRGGRFHAPGGRESSRGGGRGRGGGRFYDRGGPAGRSTYRGRGRGYEGSRDSHSSVSEWIPSSERSNADEVNRFSDSDSVGRNGSTLSRIDGRLSPQGQSFGGGRGSSGTRTSNRYDSIGSESDFLTSRHSESASEDRYGKRKREEQSYPIEHEEKRFRENDYPSWNRHPENDSRPTLPHRGSTSYAQLDDPSAKIEIKPAFDQRNVDSRGLDHRITTNSRGRTPSQRSVEETRGGVPSTREDFRGPLHRDDDRRGSINDRDNIKSSFGPSLDDDSRPWRSTYRDDDRRIRSSSGDDPRWPSANDRLGPRSDLATSNSRDDVPQEGFSSRQILRGSTDSQFNDDRYRTMGSQRRDFRDDDPRERHIGRTDLERPPPGSLNTSRSARGIDDSYGDEQDISARGHGLRSDMSIDKVQRDYHAPGGPRHLERIFGGDSDRDRSRQEAPLGKLSQGSVTEDSFRRGDPPNLSSSPGPLGDSSNGGESKASAGEYSAMDQHQQIYPRPYFSQPKQHLSLSTVKRNSWNSSYGNRSPMPSPVSGRRTQAVATSPENPVATTEEESVMSPPFNLDRGRGRGRGRGYRGRGRSDIGGRFGGRDPASVGGRLQFTPRDGAPESHFSRPRHDDAEDPKRPADSSASDEIASPPQKLAENRDQAEEKPMSQTADAMPPIKQEQSQQQQSQPDQLVSSSAQQAELEASAGTKPDEAVSSTPSSTIASVKKEAEKSELEKALEPPPVGEPSGWMKALCRLVVLKEQMEYCYARHMQLVKRHELLKVQSAKLQELPVGFDAFKEDYEAYIESLPKAEDQELLKTEDDSKLKTVDETSELDTEGITAKLDTEGSAAKLDTEGNPAKLDTEGNPAKLDEEGDTKDQPPS